jgi:trk system potassium uptake protein TrkH
MINYRIIARVFSILLVFEGLMMLITVLISFLFSEKSASSFLYSAIITLLTGIFVFTPLKDEDKVYGNREGYIIVTGAFILFGLFGTLPFLFSGSIKNFTDAFFESVSGFTTTGATIITDIDSEPKAILFWRSITQWIGGIGVIFLSLYVLPIFRDLNIQLSTTEFSGRKSDKIHPRAADAVKRLIAIYATLTLSEVILLALGGMPLFDAVCNSFSTLSTGGFSTHNNSLTVFESPYIKAVITVFMFIAGTNLTIVYFAAKRDFKTIRTNTEFNFYVIICLFFITITAGVLYLNGSFSTHYPLIDGAFHTISVITTTGFYTHDYTIWGNLVMLIMFIMMFTGGMAGSASGGIKISRLLVMTRNSRIELRRLIHPDAYIPVRLNSKIIPQSYVYNILVFVTIYFLILCLSSFIITFMGYDLITSLGTSAAMLGNIGPGFGSTGPFTTYAAVPAAGKWFMMLLMLIGRLEIIAFLILFSRSFYRK